MEAQEVKRRYSRGVRMPLSDHEHDLRTEAFWPGEYQTYDMDELENAENGDPITIGRGRTRQESVDDWHKQKGLPYSMEDDG